MRLLVTTAVALAIAACDNAPNESGPGGPVGAGGPVGGNAANSAAPVEPDQAGDLPRQNEPLRFLGKWAANDKACQSAAWRFTPTTLQTPAGASCSFNRVTEVQGGYDIQATCTARGQPASDMLKLRFSVLVKAMLLESQTFGDAPLVYCGRDA